MAPVGGPREMAAAFKWLLQKYSHEPGPAFEAEYEAIFNPEVNDDLDRDVLGVRADVAR